METSNIEKIKGIILPEEWDKKGNVIVVTLATYQETKYRIVENALGKRLFSYLRQRVEVTGTIVKNDVCHEIRVRSFCLDTSV